MMAATHTGRTNASYNSYKVPGLCNPILETPHISYLEDRYVLGPPLGWGQFGIIRSCSDMLTGEALACKSIAKDHLVLPDDLCGVKLEIEVMARLSGHPNVVDLKAVYEDKDSVHLIMELCAGGELFHCLEEQGRFSEHEAAVLFRHLMEVVAYCHGKGIVHRDLKPENILLVSKSASSPIKLADFGLATYITPGQSLSGTVGSPFYIAPEVLSGGYNEAADVWSAGVILYILLSGIPPFWGKTKSRIFESIRSAELWFPSDPWDRVSDSAKELITGMLRRDRSHRLTAKQVLHHSWIKEHADQSQDSCKHCQELSLRKDDLGSCSFSTASVPCSRDASFSAGTQITCRSLAEEPSSPTFTCRSSFSAFVVDNTPCPTTGFSFHGMCESNDLTFSPPVASMPSFSFFSAPEASEQGNILAFSTEAANSSSDKKRETITAVFNSASAVTVTNCLIFVENGNADPGFYKLLLPPDATTACVGHDIAVSISGAAAEAGRASKGNVSRVSGINSRRNHTIGLGEREHLDVVVTESVIRWASCTHLSTATSLRSSLVC